MERHWVTEEKRRQAIFRHRQMMRRAGKCIARWDGQYCGAKLTDADRLDNIDGYCAHCAGILSDNGEW